MKDSQSELREMIARALDGDLTRPERRALFTQLGSDPAACGTVAEVIALENDLAALGAAYEEAADAAAQPTDRPLPGSAPVIRLPRRFSFPAGLISGALAASLLFAAYLGLYVPDQDPDRLDVFAIAFEHKADLAEWSHEHEILAGHSARLTIHSASADPFHLRVAGTAPVDLAVEHRRRGEEPQQDRIGGARTHYAVLRDPQPGDELIFRNSSPEPVRISLAAGDASAASFHREMADAGAGR
ncbi:MAG TPA: hypothetical protein VKZ87_10180 [Ferrovibrio sp.]|uniref:hypothetical protein n=1 Tax=Ferrovibrio sp. TaxID=1917215 RepID=UPI002B4B7865|nr:hypothetical protein [Ferrovibrio sp.]HLT77744.1 hypothetical protein [Ferrovibrio sp.]